MEPTAVTRELTLEEAISLAILLEKNDQVIDANEIYRRVLETVPDHPRALHYAGVLAHQEGRTRKLLRSSSAAYRSCLSRRTGTAI